MEADMEQFRKQLEADREKRLAGGRNRSSSLGVKKGKVGKKDKKKKVRRSLRRREHEWGRGGCRFCPGFYRVGHPSIVSLV